MNEKIKLFLQKVEGDEALAAKMRDIKNPDEAYALAASVQDGFTKDEFVAAMEGIRTGDLTPDDLEMLAGGIDVSDVSEATASASVVTAGAAAWAAI